MGAPPSHRRRPAIASPSALDARRAPARARWGARLATAGSAFTSAITHAPENAAYGLMALAPLGAAFGPVAMALALLGAAVASATASLAGSGRLVGDAGAALALLTAGLVGALVARLPGPPDDAAWQVLPLVAVGIAAAGVLVALFGALRIGSVVKFTPYAVRVGLASGVGLLLMLAAAPAIVGQRFGAGLATTEPIRLGAVLVGGCAFGVTAWAARRRTRVPPVLLGLASATVLQLALAAAGWGATLGSTVGVPVLPPAWLGGAAGTGAWLQALGEPAVLALLGSFALTAAIIASLDALLAASVIDGRLRRSRNANRELMAQGLSNLASAVAGGLPASPSVPASLGLVTAQPGRRHIVLAYAGALVAVLLLGPLLLGALPMSAVGGVLAFLGATMIAPALWQTPWRLLRDGLRRRPAGAAAAARPRRARLLAADWAVTAAVAGTGVAVGLAEAVAVGATLAVLLFVRSNIRSVVRRVWRGSARHSLKTRAPQAADALQRAGHRLVLLELQGPLFFGTADALRGRLHALAPGVDTAILDLHQVGEIDGTAARILGETAEDWAAMGKRLVFAEWPAADPRRELLETVVAAPGAPSAPALHFEDDADAALEHAEDALLDRLRVKHPAGEPLPLAQTTLARGLDAQALAQLAAAMTPHRFARGEVLFRTGDPGDALYLILDGEVGLRVPGSQRRLVSFAPGVTVGEIAVLAPARRSAEAYAESDVQALGLTVDAFQRLQQDDPRLAAQLYANIALHLSERVRGLTGDLSAWMARSAAGRTPSPDTAADPAPPPADAAGQPAADP